ncbi:Integumentary mucin C.1 [Exaiptasia diaphana]|nr:Integumentary mucin C.1 [Exaiptasia diaphana]
MMKNVALLVTLAGICVLGKPSWEDSGQCAIYGSNRIECGWLGIDENTCLKRGCCWDKSDYRAAYCYVKKGAHLLEGQCPVAPSERQECGYFGITRQQCLSRMCCWDDSVPNTKYCFKEPKMTPAGCYIYHGISGICRFICRPGEAKIYGVYSCGGRVCCNAGRTSGK